jgi:hypothetical protein
MPGIFTIRFWQVRDIRRLYRLHQLLTERFCQGGSPVNRFDTEYGSDAVRYLCADLEGPLRDQVKAGYLTKGPEGLRPTIKGAAIMAWKELRPIKSIRRWREKRNAERLLADLEGK